MIDAFTHESRDIGKENFFATIDINVRRSLFTWWISLIRLRHRTSKHRSFNPQTSM